MPGRTPAASRPSQRQNGGKSHTCDLRGKRFAIVMAGNPYTESGEVFKTPDMLANREALFAPLTSGYRQEKARKLDITEFSGLYRTVLDERIVPSTGIEPVSHA